jgi:MoaA/NifB/PqqE/SkfB family radical SAM enzyme
MIFNRFFRQASIHGIHSAHGPNAPFPVNYSPSRKCNYTGVFCFHTEASLYVLPVAEAKRGLWLLKEAGMRKLNIAGGEPFLYPKFLAESLRYSKEELRLESVSIVSNSSKILEKWMQELPMVRYSSGVMRYLHPRNHQEDRARRQWRPCDLTVPNC